MNCNCDVCKAMCRRPCWGTPAEMTKLIDARYGHRLMLDYWEGYDRIYLICPAEKGREGMRARPFPLGGCVFQLENGFCELHVMGLKPKEGREAFHDLPEGAGYKLHRDIAEAWDTPVGRILVRRWEETYRW